MDMQEFCEKVEEMLAKKEPQTAKELSDALGFNETSATVSAAAFRAQLRKAIIEHGLLVMGTSRGYKRIMRKSQFNSVMADLIT